MPLWPESQSIAASLSLPADALQRSFLLIPAVFSLVAACAPVTSLDGQRMPMRSDAFSEYVESVFRQQNDVATQLAFALDREEFDSPSYVLLEAAELGLLEACAGLNDLAVRRRDGSSAGGLGAARAARRAPACEQAAVEAQAVIDGLGDS